jgi:hypothetical protein
LLLLLSLDVMSAKDCGLETVLVSNSELGNLSKVVVSSRESGKKERKTANGQVTKRKRRRGETQTNSAEDNLAVVEVHTRCGVDGQVAVPQRQRERDKQRQRERDKQRERDRERQRQIVRSDKPCRR